MSVTFSEAFMCDMNTALSIEDVFEMYAAFAGVHDTEFDSLIDAFDGGDWSGDGTWTLGSSASGTPDGVNDVDVLWWDGDTPTSFVADIHVGSGNGPWTIAFRGNGAGNYYALRVGAFFAEFYKVTNGVPSKLTEIDSGYSVWAGPAHIRLTVREYMFSDREYDNWLLMSAWMDDQFLLSSYDNLQGNDPGVRFGVAVFNGDSQTVYTSIRIPDLAEIVPYSTIDPDETASGAISRAIGDRHIKYFVRWNGALRAWRPKSIAVAQTFTKSHQVKFTLSEDLRELVNHVRMYYLLSWVEAFDQDSINKYGHRFREVISQVIESEDEAYDEASAIIRRSHEAALSSSFLTYLGGLFLEPEDRISLPNGTDYWISSLSWEWRQQRIMVDINGREYRLD